MIIANIFKCDRCRYHNINMSEVRIHIGKYKMLCIDIDGTLLNSNHKISTETKNTIKKLSKDKNIPVILVSARMPKGIDFLQEELEIKEPIICYSGALVLDKEYNTIFKNYIESEHVRKIIEKTKKYNLHVSIYSDERWIIEKE